jgi:hypothetical protein
MSENTLETKTVDNSMDKTFGEQTMKQGEGANDSAPCNIDD